MQGAGYIRFSPQSFPVLSQDVYAVLSQCCTNRNKEVGMVILAPSLPHHISNVQGKKRLGWKAPLVIQYFKTSGDLYFEEGLGRSTSQGRTPFQ